MDVLGAFLDEACRLGPQLRVTAKALFAAYTTWCERTGEHAENQRTFGMRLTERGLRRERGRAGWSWFGVGLVEPEEA
jgi:putative DNA primase/helicase